MFKPAFRKRVEPLLPKFVTGKTTYDLGPLSLEWNGHFRRHLYKQRMLVWRDLGDVELVLSESKRPIHFRDARVIEPGHAIGPEDAAVRKQAAQAEQIP